MVFRAGGLTIRCRRLATAAINNYLLLAKALVSGSSLARPQAPKLKRWADTENHLLQTYHIVS
jgi:hypothetical protein